MPTYGPDSTGEFLRDSAIDYRDALPGSGDFVGHIVSLTAGSIGVYSWNGSAWIGPFAGVAGGGNIAVRKNGVLVGTRGQLNFIEGSNVTLTLADDGTEIDITIAATGSGGTQSWARTFANMGA